MVSKLFPGRDSRPSSLDFSPGVSCRPQQPPQVSLASGITLLQIFRSLETLSAQNTFKRQAQRSIPLVGSVFFFRLVCNKESGPVLIQQIVICSFSCQQCRCCHHRPDKHASFGMEKERTHTTTNTRSMAVTPNLDY